MQNLSVKNFLSDHFLLFLFFNSEEIFKTLKNNKKTFMLKFENCKTAFDVLDVLFFDFFDFFMNEKIENNYFIFYFLYQSFFLDPENYFLYDEDVVQTLAVNTYASFISYYNKYYSYENLVNQDELIDYTFFIIKNFSRSMTLEFKNIKRALQTDSKKPCSFYSDSSFSFSEVFKDINYNNDYIENSSITLNNIKEIWKKK